MVKHIITLILLAAMSCHAQVLLTLTPTNTTLKTLDMRNFSKAMKAIRTGKPEDRMGNEDLIGWIESGQPIPAKYPALADPSKKVAVPWTGNLTADVARINARYLETHPALTNYAGKLKGKSRKRFVEDNNSAIRAATGVPKLRDAVADMLEMLDARMDALEEANQFGIRLEDAAE